MRDTFRAWDDPVAPLGRLMALGSRDLELILAVRQ
jgi:hypothetical protein